MFLIIIINGVFLICVCFNYNVYVFLLEVIINEFLQMFENNKELMMLIMIYIKYRYLYMMIFRWYIIYENRGILNNFCMECFLYCLFFIKQINFYYNGGIQVGMLKLFCKIFEILVVCFYFIILNLLKIYYCFLEINNLNIFNYIVYKSI